MKRFFILLLAVLIFACTTKEDKKTVGLVTDSAMVVSAHPLASHIGTDILKKGGNAVDAAIAVQFALAVVFPAAGNIGGGGFMVVRLKDGTTASLDFREKAPANASTNMYLDKDGNVVPDANNLVNFKISGTAFIAGVDNGSETDHESFKANYRKAFNGLALAIIQSKDKPGNITLTATSNGLQSAMVVLQAK